MLQAARDSGIQKKLLVVTTDLFPALVHGIRAGSVMATIYQRPRTQGRMAFRVLHEFLMEGECPTFPVTLAPHLVMRGFLDFFLERKPFETGVRRGPSSQGAPAEVGGYSVG